LLADKRGERQGDAPEHDKRPRAELDVALVEPLPTASPLWDMPNVLISPHSASTAPSENRKITDIFCHNLRAYLDGRPGDMKNVLDKQRRY
jgi:phosphoglycerate dehydrogenase-like enzyme